MQLDEKSSSSPLPGGGGGSIGMTPLGSPRSSKLPVTSDFACGQLGPAPKYSPPRPSSSPSSSSSPPAKDVEEEPFMRYPFNSPTYQPVFDQGQWAANELREESDTWRSEKWAATTSHVTVADYNSSGEVSIAEHDDASLLRLAFSPDQPKVRFVLLSPTNQEMLLHTIHDRQRAAVLVNNELLDPPDTPRGRGAGDVPPDQKSRFNITRRGLLALLSRYDIAPLAASHIRGQEQIFGSRLTYDDEQHSHAVKAIEFWYAIRMRCYFPANVVPGGKEGDLKATIVTRYNVATNSTFILLKHRSFNDLTERLKAELLDDLRAVVSDPHMSQMSDDPVGLGLFHFNRAVQYYRRAARVPRDAVRDQERAVHRSVEELRSVNLEILHLVMGSLDQDRVQQSFMIDVLKRLRGMHDQFYTHARAMPDVRFRPPVARRVAEELDRYEHHLRYYRSSVDDVHRKAQNLLTLSFNMQNRYMAAMSLQQTQQGMVEAITMRTIAIMTMLFLPATVVTGFLSTNVINFSDSDPGGGLNDEGPIVRVSRQWWILPAVAVPLTAVVLVVYYFWGRLMVHRVRRMNLDGSLKKEMKDV